MVCATKSNATCTLTHVYTASCNHLHQWAAFHLWAIQKGVTCLSREHKKSFQKRIRRKIISHYCFTTTTEKTGAIRIKRNVSCLPLKLCRKMLESVQAVCPVLEVNVTVIGTISNPDLWSHNASHRVPPAEKHPQSWSIITARWDIFLVIEQYV